MKTLIVDDEPIARQVLLEYLETFSEINVIGEAENGQEALRKIREAQPDLVFLDLQMPVMGGFEVARALGGATAPILVIVTAFDEHAIQAFEAGAVDYLLKPVSEARLRKAVDRAMSMRDRPVEIANHVARIAAAAAGPPVFASGSKVVGRDGGGYVLLNPDEVLAFQAEAELVWIVTSKQRFLSAHTLRVIEERFQFQQFQRVHRNTIVNVNHIRKMSAMTSQRWLITLSNSLQVVVSKRQAHNIRKVLRC